MKNKNKVTLGLLIFILGAFMAACGGKESSNNTPAAAPAPIPDTFTDTNYGCSNSCEQDYSGTFRINNSDEYLNTFGYSNNGGSAFGDNFFQQILGEVAFSIADPVMNAVRCGTQIYVTQGIARLFGIDDVDIECSVINDEYSLRDSFYGNTQDIGSTTPSATVELAIYQNQVEAIRLTIQSSLGTDQMVFEGTSNGNIFESRTNSNILLYNRNGRLELVNSGVLVGYFYL